jgi:ribonuclease P protein component
VLPKNNRLKKTKDIKRVFKGGSAFREAFLLLRPIKNSLNNTRFVFVVGKNVSKKATIRNKIRRKIREAVRLRMSEIKKGFDVVFVVSKVAIPPSFKEVSLIVDKVLKKAKLI